MIEAGGRVPAPTPINEEAPTPTKKDTSHKYLPNEVAEIGANTITQPAMTKSKQ